MSDKRVLDIQAALSQHGIDRREADGWSSKLRREFPELVGKGLKLGLTKSEIALRTGVSRDTVERAVMPDRVA